MNKPKKVVIGIDQSYTRTGITVLIDKDQIYRMTSVDFEGCENNTDKRSLLYCYLERILKRFDKPDYSVMVLTERIRLRSQGFLSESYTKSTGALVANVIDVCKFYHVPVYSVDTRAWKSAIVGTSKPENNPYGINPEKYPTIQFVKRKGLLSRIVRPYHGRGKQGIIQVKINGVKTPCEIIDDIADSYCIALYGFLPEEKQKLKEETF